MTVTVTDYEVKFSPYGHTNYAVFLKGEQVTRTPWDRDAYKWIAEKVLRGVVELDTFTASYVECLIWTATDDIGGGLADDLTYENMSADDLGAAIQDCVDFQRLYGKYFEGREGEAGHDFCLTRNGHGAGFWDGDWSESSGLPGLDLGDFLSAACKPYGTQGLFCHTDDGGNRVLDMHN